MRSITLRVTITPHHDLVTQIPMDLLVLPLQKTQHLRAFLRYNNALCNTLVCSKLDGTLLFVPDLQFRKVYPFSTMEHKKAISYDLGLIIKASAVLLMLFHHCFAFPYLYVDVPDFMRNECLLKIAFGGKICVAIFSFLTGWTYFHHCDKSVFYSVSKIVAFLLNYWIVVLPIALFASLFCGYDCSQEIIGELIPVLPHPLMIFTWYVWFYILLMLLFPFIGIIDKKDASVFLKVSIAVFLLACLGVTILLKTKLGISFHLTWYPSALVGYLCAKYRVLELFVSLVKSKIVAFAVAPPLMVLCVVFFQCSSKHNSGYISAPLFVFSLLLLYHALKGRTFWNAFAFIGKHSMNIWFFHCIFFSGVTRGVVQNVFFISDHPLWIFFIVFVVSLMLSVLVMPVQQLLNHQVVQPLFLMMRRKRDAVR